MTVMEITIMIILMLKSLIMKNGSMNQSTIDKLNNDFNDRTQVKSTFAENEINASDNFEDF